MSATRIMISFVALGIAACAGDDALPDVDVAVEEAIAETIEPETADDTSDVEAPTARWHTVLADLPERLHHVWGFDPYDIWVTGADGLVVHGGPGGWRQLDLREVDPGGGALHAAFGTSSSDVWFVGDGGRAFWFSRTTGRVERMGTSTDAALVALWGASDTAMWAVGGPAFPASGPPVIVALGPTLAMRADLPDDLPEDAMLLDVWGRAADDVWAVGEAGLALHWNGVEWSRVEVGTGARLGGVTGWDGDVLIAGGSFGALILERKATMAAFADVSPIGAALDGIATGPDGSAWAVGVLGQRFARAGALDPWVDHTDPTTPYWHDVWVDGRGDVWVAGRSADSGGRLERFGPPRADLPSGPLVRVDDPDPEADPDVEVSDGDDGGDGADGYEVIEDTGPDIDTTLPDWPFVVGTVIGSDMATFTPIVPGQAMPLIHGPQGGFHIEVVVRFPWSTSDAEVVAGLRLGLFVGDTRQAVYETSGYPFSSIGGGVFQTFIVPVMFDCIFTAAMCQSTEFDGKPARLDIVVEPPGLSWSGSLPLMLEDTW